MSSTGPLNLNWLSNVVKPRTRSTEGDAETPGTTSQASLARDEAALAPSQERYMAWTNREPFDPVSAEAPESPKAEAPPSNALEVDWVTATPSGGGTGPISANQEASAGLDVEWQTGNASSQSLGGSYGNTSPPSSGGLGVEWRVGSSSLGVSSGGGGRTGGLDVAWGGNAGGSDAIDAPAPETDSAIRPEPAPAIKPPAESTTKPTNATPLDSARLTEIRQQLAGPLPALPERPAGDNWQQTDLRNRAALIVGIRGDAALQAAFADWDRLPNDLRLEAGKRIAALEGEAYGFEPAALKLDTTLSKPSYGYYHPGEDAVHLSPDTFTDLKEFVNSVTHEQAHAYQWEKAEDAKKGRMATSDPLYATAMAWHANYFNYVEPSHGYQAYRTQPLEAHAFAVGDAVSAGVFS